MNNRVSVATIQGPEFINLQPLDINPLMSGGEVKVLYVGQNRNGSAITKKVATEMAKTLRGCPIVGHYIESKQDFGDHGHEAIINSEGVKFNTLTKPYGFVSPNAKVWFQFFEDIDEFGNAVVREYLMTQCYLWTGQFPECARVWENHNPQSMELDETQYSGHWATDNKSGLEFFIINDAVFSKLCILGDDVEPCFEGASFVNSEFTKDEFMADLLNKVKELKFTLNNSKGGKNPMHDTELGNGVEPTLFENQNTVVQIPTTNFDESAAGDAGISDSGVEGVGEPAEGAEPTEDTTAVEGVVLNDTDTALINELSSDYAPVGETVTEALIKDGATNTPQQTFQKKEDKDDDPDEKDDDNDPDDDMDNDDDKKKKNFVKSSDDKKKEEDSSEDKEDEDKKKKEEDYACRGDSSSSVEDKKKKKDFSLEEQLAQLQTQFEALRKENAELLAFKQKVDNEEKDTLIASFYMLSDEDKKDVIANKANYSLREIKAELSMICVDKKVNFNLEEKEGANVPLTFNLNAHQADNTPAWIKAIEDVKNSK